MPNRLQASACACALLLLSAPAGAGERCNGAGVLSKAAHAYRRLGSFSDTVSYTIRVPGAPERIETSEYGFDPEVRAYIRMPELYSVVVEADRLLLMPDQAGATTRYLQRPADPDLQASVDAAFEGRGPPLVPVPLLLATATDLDAEAQAFRTRLLHTLHAADCRRSIDLRGGGLEQVILEADNGSVRADFDLRSRLLTRYRVEISTGRESAPVTAEVVFAPRAGVPPQRPTLASYARLQQVKRFSELAGESADVPADPLRETGLQSVDARPVVLDTATGEITILEFWARWCAPCRFTLPSVERVATWARQARLPVQVMLINTADDFESASAARPEVERFLRWAGVSLPTVLDLDGRFLRRFGGGLPLTIVISGDGRVVGRYGGFDAELEQKLRKQVNELLGSHGAGPGSSDSAASSPASRSRP